MVYLCGKIKNSTSSIQLTFTHNVSTFPSVKRSNWSQDTLFKFYMNFSSAVSLVDVSKFPYRKSKTAPNPFVYLENWNFFPMNPLTKPWRTLNCWRTRSALKLCLFGLIWGLIEDLSLNLINNLHLASIQSLALFLRCSRVSVGLVALLHGLLILHHLITLVRGFNGSLKMLSLASQWTWL